MRQLRDSYRESTVWSHLWFDSQWILGVRTSPWSTVRSGHCEKNTRKLAHSVNRKINKGRFCLRSLWNSRSKVSASWRKFYENFRLLEAEFYTMVFGLRRSKVSFSASRTMNCQVKFFLKGSNQTKKSFFVSKIHAEVKLIYDKPIKIYRFLTKSKNIWINDTYSGESFVTMGQHLGTLNCHFSAPKMFPPASICCIKIWEILHIT